MSEAYETRMDSIALKIRWISVQCYEMVLPGGKTLVTDPFYWDMSHFDGLTVRIVARFLFRTKVAIFSDAARK